MPKTEKRCWLTFEGGCQDEPCLWRMARRFPDVVFDVRQASVGKAIGIMALKFEGEQTDVEAALAYLVEMGVRVDPVQGGSMVAG
ncbi:MAG: NIL domain-containing protein [Phycisphaeraceae bacterium]|nr:NIL domain-containing protein [Phycisphaeraceae bacterium]